MSRVASRAPAGHRARQPAARRPILIVSAFAPELAPLRRALRNERRPLALVGTRAVGIGPVEAAAGAAGLVAAIRPRLVLFVGTAGAYGAAPAVGTAVVARRILLASAAVASGQGYRPRIMPTEADSDPGLRRALLDAAQIGAASREVDVATPAAITTSPALARRLSRLTGAGVENLEVFAVARVAAAARVPFAAVLGISNRVGPRAHAEWVRHGRQATVAATKIVLAFLSQAASPASR